MDEDNSGTYDAPIVLKADPGVEISCCSSSRATCFNLEYADYVAVDGFTLKGGSYGVRAVGGYETHYHQKGVAILNNHISGQYKDPILSGGSDWIVVENNIAHGAGSGDGHGIYLSNGGDWMIVRNNETYDNPSSDFQINADPISTCDDEGISYDDPLCDGSALDSLGAGVSEFNLIEANYFHDGSIGPNLTSVRNSVFRNNIIGFYSRHGTSFWQETDNPKLGSANNLIEHNLFMGESSSHVLQFINHSGNNTVRNNVLLAVSRSDTSVSVRSNTLLLEQDSTTEGKNNVAGNYFVGGYFEGFSPGSSDFSDTNFDASWFVDFPYAGSIAKVEAFKPVANAPIAGVGELLSSTPKDRSGVVRVNPTDLGPWQITLPNSCSMSEETVTTTKTVECEAMDIPGGYEILDGGDVTFRANYYVSFARGFHVGDGGIIHALTGVSIP
ncbi:right-handed parallel beta-helix repeat-containing protein [Thiolapillus sp.]|uniref:right-handed parallel beta-helix repeat-containing protein n=5 Tax=Thiolapillus sp. TaxID=2017437 RepID=UPI0025F154CF|nr:right-handed parallel beta-helix repeat-containing protein [Thiolapillus sp.]